MAAGQGVAVIASILVIKVVASNLSTEEYGRLALGLTAATLLNQFILGPLGVGAVRHYVPARERGQLRSLIAVLDSVLLRIGVLWLLAGVAVFVVMSLRWQGSWALLWLLLFVFALLQNVQAVYNGLQVAARRRAPAAVHQALEPLARLVAGGGAALVLPTAPSVAFGYVLGVSLVFLSQAVTFRRSLASEPPEADMADRSELQRALLGYSKYVAISGAFTFLLLASDRWALKIFRGDAEVGVYVAAAQLAALTAVVPGLVGQLLNPIVFERAGDATDPVRVSAGFAAVRIAAGAVAAWVAVCTVAAALLGTTLLELFASSAYAQAGPCLGLIVYGLGMIHVGNTLGLVPLMLKRMRGFTVLRAVHSVFALTLNVLGAWWWGIGGLAYGLALSGSVYVACVVINNLQLKSRPLLAGSAGVGRC